MITREIPMSGKVAMETTIILDWMTFRCNISTTVTLHVRSNLLPIFWLLWKLTPKNWHQIGFLFGYHGNHIQLQLQFGLILQELDASRIKKMTHSQLSFRDTHTCTLKSAFTFMSQISLSPLSIMRSYVWYCCHGNKITPQLSVI